MQPKKKLKVIPLYGFFKKMDLISKLLFLVLFISLLGVTVATVISAEDPTAWVLDVNEYIESSEEEVQLREYQRNYRTMGTEIGAWKETVTYVATPIVPKAWLVLVFIACQVLGWAYLLTAATYIKNWLAYVLYFVFAMVLFLARTFESVAPDSYWLFNIGLALGLLVPAFLLQQGIIKLKFIVRFLIFLILTALPFAMQYEFGGWNGLHSASVGMYTPLVIILFLFLFFIGNDINNIIFFAATNSKNRKFRVKFPIIFGVFLAVTALEVLMLQKEMGWNLIPLEEDLPIRPIHLIAFASVIMVATKQAMFPPLRNFISIRAMSFAFAALALISMSTIFFHVSLGEYLFLHMVERLAVMFFLVTGIFHFFYMFYNFGPLIRARVNFYFLSMMPKRLMFFFVVIATVLVCLALEASDHFKSKRIYSSTLYNRLADEQFLQDDLLEAMGYYLFASGAAKGTVKGNYNLAMLSVTNGDKPRARDHFELADNFFPFPYSALNWANLEVDSYVPTQGKFILKEFLKRNSNPYISNNLAQLYLAQDRPDSAIMQLKDALRQAPEQSALYANLGRIYLDYDKPEWATKFLKAGLEAENLSSAVVTNALFHNLRHDAGIHVSDSLLRHPEVKGKHGTEFNFALDRYKSKDFSGAEKLLAPMLGIASEDDTARVLTQYPDALLLDGMLLFEKGKIAESLSRMAYLDNNYPPYKRYTGHYLGVGFFAADVPEMAAEYFRQSYQGGRSADLINEALMEIDAGNQEYAFELMKAAQEQDSTLFDLVNKETAMLQLARGEYFMASIGFDLGSLSKEEWMRVGHYAGAIRNKPAALEAFSKVILLDSNSVSPYLEMGRISLAMRDSAVLDNLRPALEMEPKNLEVRIEMARAHLWLGQTVEAEALYRELAKESGDDRRVKFLGGQVMAAKGDSAAAIKTFERLHATQPLDQGTVIELSRLYRGKRMDFEGQNMVYDALAINHRNAEFWYEMAHFERLLNREDACGGAAVQAINLETDPDRKAQIKAEFEPEIGIYRELNPENNE